MKDTGDTSTTSEMENFLRKVLEIQTEDEDCDLSEETLKLIAMRAGLSESDWERICLKLESYFLRGKSFLTIGNGGEAIAELESALALAPYRSDVVAACGEAHYLNWKENRNSVSKTRAEMLFRKCLESDPVHEGAIGGLSRLREPAEQTLRKRTNTRNTIWGGIFAALLLGGAGVGALLIDKSTFTLPKPNSEETVSKVSVAEFSRWLQQYQFSFSGWYPVSLQFDSEGGVLWESSGSTVTHPYTIETSGKVIIHGKQEFEIEFSPDLQSGTFQSNVGKYVLKIEPKPR